MEIQVFHDPSGRRARSVQWVLAVVVAAVLVASAMLVAAVVRIDLHSAPTFARTGALRHAVAPPATVEGGEEGPWLPKPAANASAIDPLKDRIGFYMPWDEESRRSLSANVDRMAWVAAGLATVHGAGHDWHQESDDDLRRILRDHPRTRLLLMVQNVSDAGWDGRNTERLFSDPAARRTFLDRLDRAIVAEQAAGVVLDMESLPAGAHQGYLTLLKEARARFAGRGILLTIAAPVGDPEWDLAAYGRVVDRVILMAYDEHWPDSAAGPVASQPWFTRMMAEAVRRVGRDKAVIAIGNYAYDWGVGKAEPLTVQQAWQRAAEARSLPQFDTASGNSHFSYQDRGVRHQVWMLDALSTWNQVQAVRQVGAAGVALWRLGSEDPGFWTALDTPAGKAPPLAHLPAPQGALLSGEGEILRLAGIASPGARDARPAVDGLIHAARYMALPTPHLIERAGHQRRRVALTFDDGPDPRWTPQILDILKTSHAPATFFVTGANALGEDQLLRRIIAEGSEIGNHSTTHADLDRLSDEGIRLELNTTQRLVESYTGRSMRLFRAPYLGDADPNSAGKLRSARIASEMGYLTVGLNVDPLDWTATTADRIVARTVEQVESGDATHSTQIVLLHDSGGDRSATVAALPRIIRTLRARGYELVTVSRLAGIPHEAVMPQLAGSQETAAGSAGLLFLGLAWLWKGLAVLFVAAITLGIARAVLLTTLALLHARREAAPEPAAHLVPSFVSVIIPAFNEERVIEASVRRVLASEGPRIEVIVVDDGSTDRTSGIVAKAFGLDPRVTLLTIENGGKARALNRALGIARGDIVIALDADTRFEPDTIARLSRWFADPRIGAVAGNAKIGNRINLLTRWQSVEYVTAQGLERRALSALDAITVVPGAVGAWRRRALDAVGGYPADTLAEDQDLTIAIQRAGWKVACDVDAVAWTEAPETVRGLFKQRYRWAFGTLQCLWKHRSGLLTGTPRGLFRFGIPQAWLFQIGFSLISPIIDLALVASIVDTGLRLVNHGFALMQGNLATILGFWLAFTVVDVACGWVAYRLDGREGRVPVMRLLLQRFGYRQLLYAVVVKAVFSAISGPRVGWGKLERSGQFTVETAQPSASPVPAAACEAESLAA